MRVAGIDRTKGGWVAVVLEDGRFARDHLIRAIESDFGELVDVSVVAIDVPIGFGPRDADAAAREFLRGAASTVFTTPSRAILEAPFRPGLGVSAQAHALGPRIRHVTGFAKSDARLVEVHPEVSFRAMSGGRPLSRKRSAAGVLERVELLRKQGIGLGALQQAAEAPVDDVLDVAAAAWERPADALGQALSLPDPPQVVDGTKVAIWY